MQVTVFGAFVLGQPNICPAQRYYYVASDVTSEKGIRALFRIPNVI